MVTLNRGKQAIRPRREECTRLFYASLYKGIHQLKNVQENEYSLMYKKYRN